MKLFALTLLGRLIGQPVFLDVPAYAIYGPVVLMLAVPVLIIVVAVVLYKVLKKRKR